MFIKKSETGWENRNRDGRVPSNVESLITIERYFYEVRSLSLKNATFNLHYGF